MHATATSTTPLLCRARQLAALRFAVIPILWRTKRPLVKWKPYQTRLPGDGELARWFTPHVRSMAVLCGGASGGLLCIDFDVLEFYHHWLALVGAHVAALPAQRTGKGMQVFCRCAEPGRSTKLAAIPDRTQPCGWRIAIETRGDGGYACVDPSLHPCGRHYAFVHLDLPEVPFLDASAVEFLIGQARALNRVPDLQRKVVRKTANDATSALHRRRRVARLCGEADGVIAAWNERVPVAAVLGSHGYTVVGDEFSRPGKPFAAGASGQIVDCQDGVERSVHFSTNDPLNDEAFGDTTACGIHDSFDAFAALEVGGDARSAVRLAACSMGVAHRSHTDVALIGLCMDAPGTGPEFQRLFLGDAGELPRDAAVERLAELIRVHTNYDKQVHRIVNRSELRSGRLTREARA